MLTEIGEWVLGMAEQRENAGKDKELYSA